MVCNQCLCSQNVKARNRQNGERMYREDYKVTVPQFKRLEVLLSDCGAISGKLDIENRKT